MVIKEFINLVQEQTADENGNTWSKADCGLTIEYVTKAIMEAVKNNEKVSIQGFGKFELLDKKGKKRRKSKKWRRDNNFSKEISKV